MPADKVRFVDNERLDKPDADALQSLVYEYVEEAIGGMLGRVGNFAYAGGLCSQPTLTWLPGYVLSFGKFYFYRNDGPQDLASVAGFDNNEGSLHKFDPSSAIQAGSTSIDLSAEQAAGQTPFIFARISDVDSDTDNRRKWDSSAGAESVVSMTTRTRKKVTFVASSSDVPPQAGDVLLLRVMTFVLVPSGSVEASTTNFKYQSFLDFRESASPLQFARTGVFTDTGWAYTNTLGIIGHLFSIRNVLSFIKGTDSSGNILNWNSATPISLSEVADVAADSAGAAWASGRINYDSSTNTFALANDLLPSAGVGLQNKNIHSVLSQPVSLGGGTVNVAKVTIPNPAASTTHPGLRLSSINVQPIATTPVTGNFSLPSNHRGLIARVSIEPYVDSALDPASNSAFIIMYVSIVSTTGPGQYVAGDFFLNVTAIRGTPQ